MKSKIIETLFDWDNLIKINLDGYNDLKRCYENKEENFFECLSETYTNDYEYEYELLTDEFLTLSSEDGTTAFKCGFEHGIKSVASVFGKGC